MPACNKCGHIAATADMRRSPTGGYLCRDKWYCTVRVKTMKEERKA